MIIMPLVADAARTQEMSIDKNMTLVYDLKVDELKEKEAYKKEWHNWWLAGLFGSYDPEQRKLGSLLISPATKNSLTRT